MTSAAVIIPWRGGCEHRSKALGWVMRRWAQLPYPIVVAEHVDGPWVKAHAVTPAVAGVAADVVVVADADVWTDTIRQAVDAVDAGAAWVVPHRKVRRLTATATRHVLDDHDLTGDLELEEKPYDGYLGGGIVVARRDVYLDTPLDPRFVGWGDEDTAWALALTALHGTVHRLDGTLWHLWHPPQPRRSRSQGSAASRDLLGQYRAARRRPDRMRTVVDAAREVIAA